jgi:hypothetical protein
MNAMITFSGVRNFGKYTKMIEFEIIFMSVVCINVKKDLNILFGTDLKKTASELNISLFICKYKYNFFKASCIPSYHKEQD